MCTNEHPVIYSTEANLIRNEIEFIIDLVSHFISNFQYFYDLWFKL